MTYSNYFYYILLSSCIISWYDYRTICNPLNDKVQLNIFILCNLYHLFTSYPTSSHTHLSAHFFSTTLLPSGCQCSSNYKMYSFVLRIEPIQLKDPISLSLVKKAIDVKDIGHYSSDKH